MASELVVFIAVKLVAILIAVVSTVGNALVCHVIIRLKTMKTSINYMILNLAILDAIFGILMIGSVVIEDSGVVFGEPVLQQAYNKSSVLAEVLCRINWSFWIVPYISPYILTAMAYERYQAILHPLSALHRTKTKLKLIVVLGWLLGFGYFVVDMIVVQYDSRAIKCIDRNASWLKTDILFGADLCTQIIIPSIAMFVFYARVIFALRKQDETLQPQGTVLGPQAAAERARKQTKKKVVWIIIAITLVFYVCYFLPRVLTYFSFSYGYPFNYTSLWREISKTLLCINSAFNPFVYFLCIQSFRNGFKSVFMRRNNTDSSSGLNGFQSSCSLGNLTVEEQNQPKLLSFAVKSRI